MNDANKSETHLAIQTEDFDTDGTPLVDVVAVVVDGRRYKRS